MRDILVFPSSLLSNYLMFYFYNDLFVNVENARTNWLLFVAEMSAFDSVVVVVILQNFDLEKKEDNSDAVEDGLKSQSPELVWHSFMNPPSPLVISWIIYPPLGVDAVNIFSQHDAVDMTSAVRDLWHSVTEVCNQHIVCSYVILAVCNSATGEWRSLSVRLKVTALHVSTDISREINLVE